MSLRREYQIMKKIKLSPSEKFLFIIGIIAILLIMFMFFAFDLERNDDITEKISSTEHVTKSETHFLKDSSSAITFYEEDDDIAYNYIDNPDIFSSIDDIPYICIQSVGDELNNFLNLSGYQRKRITITEISSNKSILTFSGTISDTESIVECTYNYFNNEFTFFIKE